MKNGSKLSFFSKMSTKIALLISAVVFAVVAVEVFVATRRASKSMEEIYLNYAQNLAEEAAAGVDFAAEFGEEAYGGYTKNLAQEAAVSINFSRHFGESVYKSYAQNLAELAAQGTVDSILKDVAIKDVKGSYAYMVSRSGIMLWHPSPDKIGKPVENAAVKKIISDLKNGFTVKNGSVLYEYRGALKLAGYAFATDGNIIIVTADYNEFMKIDYNTLLGNISIEGVEGSYAYMVSPSGTMLWHPNSAKIGQPVENDAVKQIVADLQSGRYVKDGYVIYNYNGAVKMAGYSFTDTGNIVLVTADYDKLILIDYGKLIGEIKISGVKGSYAYMVSPSGQMLYHNDKSKIGKPVENAAVKSIVANINAGKSVPDGSCTYEYRGELKVAGYAFTKAGNIVIVTADRNAMMYSVGIMRKSLILYGIICELAAILLVYLFTVWMLSALNRIVPLINKTSDLDFSDDEESGRLEKRSDEIGLIARSIITTRSRLHEIVETITQAETSIDENVESLRLMIDRVNHVCGSNSARTGELAEGMKKTADTTASINRTAEKVEEHAANIGALAEEGTRLSGEVLTRANELAASTETASRRTTELYKNVKVKSEEAITASRSVDKINELISTIMSISTQTGMLSLNASIEAARAGDVGRGFAVVAKEIRNLAGQTSDVVKIISPIIAEVNSAVAKMSDCLNESISFLETSVLNDYQEFSNVSRQYKEDANTFGSSMESVKKSLRELSSEIEDIAEYIGGINSTVKESSAGVSDIAGKTSEMADDTLGSADQVNACRKVISDLNDIIHRFRL